MHVRNSEVCTFETAKCARSKQRSAHVRNSEVRTYDLLRKSVLRSFRMRKARLVVSPKPREARADQERLRRPSGAFATWQAAGEKHPSHQPGVWGRSWASRRCCCAVAARALTPIHSGSALRPCAGLWRVFRVKGGSRGWCGPQPRRGEDTAPDATGATQACRQGVGGALPRHPCPRREPPAGRRRRL